MYQKAILILQDKRFSHYIKVMMERRNKSVETSLPLLYNFNSIKDEIVKNRNTIGIRGQFGSFIKKYGFPYMIIMDYTADFGLPEDQDPDRRKLLRAFFISLIILAYGKGYGSATANIVLVIERPAFPLVSRYSKDPSVLLQQIKTTDERINTFLDSFIQDNEKARKFFNISYIFHPEDRNYLREVGRLENIISEADRMLEQNRKKEGEKEKTQMITSEKEPASVLCRATSEKILVNGEARQISEQEKFDYLEKYISLEGALTVTTMNTVKDRIIATFTAMQKLNPFKKTDKIFINIPDTTLIDGSFAPSMGSFLSNELSQYTRISIILGKTNCKKLKLSRGYFLIKDFLIKDL